MAADDSTAHTSILHQGSPSRSFLASCRPSNVLAPGIHDLFARTTLRGVPPEKKAMSCAVLVNNEAQMIDYAGIYAVLIDFGTMQCPTKVIGADPTLPYSYLPTLDLSDIMTVDYDFLPEATHLLQLEEPEQCVEAMREFIELNLAI